MRSVFVNQFTEPNGIGTAIKSSTLRFSKRLNRGGIVMVHEHNVNDIQVLVPTLLPGLRQEMVCSLRNP